MMMKVARAMLTEVFAIAVWPQPIIVV